MICFNLEFSPYEAVVMDLSPVCEPTPGLCVHVHAHDQGTSFSYIFTNTWGAFNNAEGHAEGPQSFLP